MDNFMFPFPVSNFPVSAFICLSAKDGLLNASWQTGKKSKPLIRNANRPKDHFRSFAIPFAAIRFGDGEDAISDIRERMDMEEITKSFGEAMHAVGGFFRMGEDDISAGVLKSDGPKMILNSIGNNVNGIISRPKDGSPSNSALSPVESTDNEDSPPSDTEDSDEEESPSAESRDRVTTRSPEQHRPRYLTPPPQGTPLITKTHKTSHYRNRILCILDCITISLTYLAFGSSTRGSSRNVGLAIGVGVMCCCLKKLWRKLFAQQNEGDFGTPKIQQ